MVTFFSSDPQNQCWNLSSQFIEILHLCVAGYKIPVIENLGATLVCAVSKFCLGTFNPFTAKKRIWLNQENFQILNCPTKPKVVITHESSWWVHSNGAVCVTTEESSFSCKRNLKWWPLMKALDEYFLMLAFTLLLNRVHVFANLKFNLNRETWQRKG